MTYNLIIKSWTEADSSIVRSKIVKTFDHYIKTQGLDRFESRLDAACLEIGEQLGYEFSRDTDSSELIFIQRGL